MKQLFRCEYCQEIGTEEEMKNFLKSGYGTIQ